MRYRKVNPRRFIHYIKGYRQMADWLWCKHRNPKIYNFTYRSRIDPLSFEAHEVCNEFKFAKCNPDFKVAYNTLSVDIRIIKLSAFRDNMTYMISFSRGGEDYDAY